MAVVRYLFTGVWYLKSFKIIKKFYIKVYTLIEFKPQIWFNKMKFLIFSFFLWFFSILGIFFIVIIFFSIPSETMITEKFQQNFRLKTIFLNQKEINISETSSIDLKKICYFKHDKVYFHKMLLKLLYCWGGGKNKRQKMFCVILENFEVM